MEQQTQPLITEHSSSDEFAPQSQKARTAEEVAHNVRKAGADLGRRTAEQGRALLGEQKTCVAGALHDCSDALRKAARELQEKQDPRIASYAESMAESLDKTSNYLNSHQLQDIQSDLAGFARSKPQVFFGGMFVAGLVLARFLKASEA